MTKSIIVAALLSSIAVASFAQASAPMAADGASAPAKKTHKHHHAKKPVTPAENPMASTAKTGDGK